jgi:hypothetical protein
LELRPPRARRQAVVWALHSFFLRSGSIASFFFLAVGRLLPVYPDKQPFAVSDGISQMSHGTKSLRDSPLRG